MLFSIPYLVYQRQSYSVIASGKYFVHIRVEIMIATDQSGFHQN